MTDNSNFVQLKFTMIGRPTTDNSNFVLLNVMIIGKLDILCEASNTEYYQNGRLKRKYQTMVNNLHPISYMLPASTVTCKHIIASLFPKRFLSHFHFPQLKAHHNFIAAIF